VRVKASGIHGKGLFASDWRYRNIHRGKEGPIVFRDGDKISDYTGRILTRDQMERKYPKNTIAPYAFALGRGRYVDANRTTDGFARYANSVYRPGRKNRRMNSKLKVRQGQGILQACRTIRQDQEILCDYGGGENSLYPQGAKAKKGKKHPSHR